MIWFSNKINDNYGWELSAFHKIREFSDGLTFFEFYINYDRYLADHTPRLEIMLTVCNFKLFEFNIYNLHHREDNQEIHKYRRSRNQSGFSKSRPKLKQKYKQIFRLSISYYRDMTQEQIMSKLSKVMDTTDVRLTISKNFIVVEKLVKNVPKC